MTDALEGYGGTVSIGGRTITNLRFADDIDGLAEDGIRDTMQSRGLGDVYKRQTSRRPSTGFGMQLCGQP